MTYIKNNTGRQFYDYKSEFTFVEDELLTEREFEIFCPSLKIENFTKVHVKKADTYMFFGVRFELDKGDKTNDCNY